MAPAVNGFFWQPPITAPPKCSHGSEIGASHRLPLRRTELDRSAFPTSIRPGRHDVRSRRQSRGSRSDSAPGFSFPPVVPNPVTLPGYRSRRSTTKNRDGSEFLPLVAFSKPPVGEGISLSRLGDGAVWSGRDRADRSGSTRSAHVARRPRLETGNVIATAIELSAAREPLLRQMPTAETLRSRRATVDWSTYLSTGTPRELAPPPTEALRGKDTGHLSRIRRGLRESDRRWGRSNFMLMKSSLKTILLSIQSDPSGRLKNYFFSGSGGWHALMPLDDRADDADEILGRCRKNTGSVNGVQNRRLFCPEAPLDGARCHEM